MKKVNLTIIATIIATFVVSMFAFQPTTTEASSNATPSATPSPRKIRKPSTLSSANVKFKPKVKKTSAEGRSMTFELRTKHPRRNRKN